MRDESTIEIVGLACALIMGALFFVGGISLSNTVPAEYRSASPGFGWSWDFDYASGMAEAGRFGEAPWPWPATAHGNHLLLPLDQPLVASGLKLAYQGMPTADRFRLDIGIQRLDPGTTYPQDFSVTEARRGFMIDDQQFALETITPRYLRLHASENVSRQKHAN